MRKYINQIDDEIIKLKFTDEELENYKKLTKELDILKSTVRTLEVAAKKRLEAVVIGELEGITFNYLSFGDEFYMSHTNKKRTKKWYQFWK